MAVMYMPGLNTAAARTTGYTAGESPEGETGDWNKESKLHAYKVPIIFYNV
jgi:hypothetical protein